jgi:hypothetical protein
MPGTYRNPNGQFRKAQLEDFGTSFVTCTHCLRATSYALYTYHVVGSSMEKIKNDPPEWCSVCGERLNAKRSRRFS